MWSCIPATAAIASPSTYAVCCAKKHLLQVNTYLVVPKPQDLDAWQPCHCCHTGIINSQPRVVQQAQVRDACEAGQVLHAGPRDSGAST
jgi:hypothetical protein